MKVLLINSVCGIGSTGRICTDLASVLVEQGHEAKIAYGRDGFVPKQFHKFGVRICGDWEVRLNGVINRIFDNHGFGLKTSTERLVSWIKCYDPDIIHLHNIHGYYLNVDILFKFLKLWSKPVIWTLHDCWPFTGHCVYFDYVGCDNWKFGCGHCPQKKNYPASLFLDRSNYNYKRKNDVFCGIKNLLIVTPSEWLSNLVKESFLGEYRIKVINNGIDDKVFRPVESVQYRKYGLHGKKIILGVSMGWAPHKHLDYMIRMANDLGEHYQIVLIGLSKEQKMRLPNNIIGFQKIKSVQELVRWYSTADVYVNPTMEDNYPTVNLEAQACGTPVVTFKSGGSAECIKGGYGIAVERGDYEGLLDAVKQACGFKGKIMIPHIKNNKEFACEHIRLYNSLFDK